MKTNHTQNGALRFYGPVILALIAAMAFISFSAGNPRLTPKAEETNLSPLILKVRQIYTSQIGIREKPSNRGPEVEKYLRYVNLPKGNPWCAAFVCWVYGQARVGNPRTGWSPDLFGEGRVIWGRSEQGTKSKEQGFPTYVPKAYAVNLNSDLGLQTSSRASISFIRPTQTSDLRPQTSDIFGLYFPEKRRIAHVGFIDQWDGTWVTTVEGNTNVNGSREGDGVYRKRRLATSIYKVARYIELE